MRLWSIHPKYLDTKGLTACWREGLLARKVLLGQTKGYRNHPQLIRFRSTQNSVAAVDVFLSAVLSEARLRGYNFDATKINLTAKSETIEVTQGQLNYEFEHLKKKLVIRDKTAFERIVSVTEIATNPIFTVVDGGIADWEDVKLSK
ncbi:pyrimidine dimer DNA glycosylase [Mucinivorans hirudinis]|uniref:Pyrimidine dimer DNA glycosylase n=1 Tax=Mucinivorans hirudinis TaxID=1433126 RepID=A0A060RBP3_9BACT|nr:pyrimidine dimer DNA glycosylase [Mucinivorans hirudinis]